MVLHFKAVNLKPFHQKVPVSSSASAEELEADEEELELLSEEEVELESAEPCEHGPSWLLPPLVICSSSSSISIPGCCSVRLLLLRLDCAWCTTSPSSILKPPHFS